jgi:hypothetical protein
VISHFLTRTQWRNRFTADRRARQRTPKASDHSADSGVVSPHGGRQLDRCPVSLELHPEVVAAVGDQLRVLHRLSRAGVVIIADSYTGVLPAADAAAPKPRQAGARAPEKPQ